jgi:hypothetical protein
MTEHGGAQRRQVFDDFPGAKKPGDNILKDKRGSDCAENPNQGRCPSAGLIIAHVRPVGKHRK